ncbi:MAG: NAD-binding protein [Planctomycetes bacterium]|nr:NAD-binding protein [Planctomycetota bacterium]
MEPPVILCCLGQVGSHVLAYLRKAGAPVVVVDNRCASNDPRLGGAPLISGDCRQPEVLRRAGVTQARGVLILSSDDLVNISAVLSVRHLNPDTRVVVRLFNQNLFRGLSKAVPHVVPLSTSALAGPLLALTALTGDTLGTFTLEDGRRQVMDCRVRDHSPLQGRTVAEVADRYQSLVLAHLPARGPGRFLSEVDAGARLEVGDQFIMCGEPHALAPLLEEGGEEILPHLRWAGWLRRTGRMIWRTLAEVDLAVKICTTALLSVVLASTLVYYFGVHKSLADALYRTISVMATGADMGEQELTLPWQKVFVSVLRVAGATLLAAFTAIVTNFLLRARLGGVLEIRRIPDGGHIIVCGLSNLGFRVVEELLRGGERVVVIEQDRDSGFLSAARRLGSAVIIGDSTVLEVLRQAHAATARAVVATTDSELANLEICLLARELNPRQRVVLRLSDSPLAEKLREAANIRFALSIPVLAAPAFVAALFGNRVQSVFLVGGRLLAVVELAVQPDDPFLNGQSVRALAVDYRLLPVAVTGAEGTLHGSPLEARLAPGDRLTAVTALSDLERLLRREPGHQKKG